MWDIVASRLLWTECCVHFQARTPRFSSLSPFLSAHSSAHSRLEGFAGLFEALVYELLSQFILVCGMMAELPCLDGTFGGERYTWSVTGRTAA